MQYMRPSVQYLRLNNRNFITDSTISVVIGQLAPDMQYTHRRDMTFGLFLIQDLELWQAILITSALVNVFMLTTR